MKNTIRLHFSTIVKLENNNPERMEKILSPNISKLNSLCEEIQIKSISVAIIVPESVKGYTSEEIMRNFTPDNLEKNISGKWNIIYIAEGESALGGRALNKILTPLVGKIETALDSKLTDLESTMA